MKKTNRLLFYCNLVFLSFLSLQLSAQQVVPSDTVILSKTGKDTLKAFVFKPGEVKGNHPAILLFHGGAWRLGDASWMFGRAKEFADKGIVAFAVDYRLANNGLTPVEGVEDACAAFTWVRQHAKEFNIDAKKVAGYGVSAGGHLVACAATLPYVKGKKVGDEARPNVMLLYCAALNMAHDKYFGAIMQNKDDPAKYSPSNYISSKLPPTLIIDGLADSITLAADAVAFHDEAIKAGVKCNIHIYPGVGHMLTRNLKVQYKDFDPNPDFIADAHKAEDDFMEKLGYYK